MLRIAKTVLLLAAVASGTGAQTPEDLSFGLRLTKAQPQYAPDEPIEFEVSLSSSAEKKYFACWTALTPISGPVIRLDPASDAVDLQSLVDVWGGSILGSSGVLSAIPVKETGDLTQRYRFEKAGHFRLSVEVNWVSRIRSKEEGGGREHLTLRSNEVEFEIVAPDAASEAQELETVLSEIDQASSELAKVAPLHRLDLMQTPAAAEEKVRQYLANIRPNSGDYSAMLQHSSQLDVIVPMLERALTDPKSDVPNGLVYLLSRLQVRRQMGARPPWPPDVVGQQRWREKGAEREKLADKLAAQYSEALRKSVATRSGPERVNTIFEAWANAEGRYRTGDAPEYLVELRSDVLSVYRKLSPDQQAQLLMLEWDKIPHEQLLPLIERMAKDKSGPGGWRQSAYKYWCQDWPEDCAKAILADAQTPEVTVDVETVLLLPEAEHPELDGVLKEKLEALKTGQSNMQSMATDALILRAGSKNIQEDVTKYLDLPPQPQMSSGQGYLLGYLFRIDAPGAAPRLAAKLQDHRHAYVANGTLQELGQAEHIEGAMQVTTAALNAPNLKIAGTAALLLAKRGPETSRAALMKRLEAFRAEWHERAGEVADADASDQNAFDAKQFEQALVSALAHATAWKLTPEEGESLAKDCMSEQCREMAKGTAWMGL